MVPEWRFGAVSGSSVKYLTPLTSWTQAVDPQICPKADDATKPDAANPGSREAHTVGALAAGHTEADHSDADFHHAHRFQHKSCGLTGGTLCQFRHQCQAVRVVRVVKRFRR